MISHLKQKTLVACPLAQAKQRVATFMIENGSQSASSSHITLGFHLMAGPADFALRMDHPVELDLIITSRVTALEPCWGVEWKSNDGGFYPEFRGELAVENDDYRSFWLTLRGTYEPPFGIIGTAFDVLLGSRIAAQSARELLARTASSIEAGFSADEAKKSKTESLSPAS